MKYVAAAALAALITGCSGVSSLSSESGLPSGSADTAVSLASAAKTCQASAVMQPGVAGFITLPKCFGISGKMQFPKAQESGIKITVTESAKLFSVYHALPKTVMILQWEFTDPQIANGTTVVFDYTLSGRSAPDRVNGPFKPSQTYHAVYEIPIPNDPKPDGGLNFAGATVGHSVVGVPFPGTEVEIGVKNYEIFTTDSNAP
jgi:hypothetical protein